MLRKLPSNRALPFIVLAPNGICDAKTQTFSAGALACLQKPVDPSQVVSAVQIALDGISRRIMEGTNTPSTVSLSGREGNCSGAGSGLDPLPV
jgi:CheY-like chemotaxis protein